MGMQLTNIRGSSCQASIIRFKKLLEDDETQTHWVSFITYNSHLICIRFIILLIFGRYKKYSIQYIL